MVLGEFVKPVGLRGEVKLLQSGDFWEEALQSRRLVLETAEGERAVRVEAQRVQGRGTRVLRLEGVRDRSAAEQLVGARLLMQAGELDVPGPPAPRLFQLRDASVVLPDGSRLGSVTDILPMPAHDLLVVQGAERQYLIPVVPEIVKEVDLEAGRVRIDPPAGLLEL